MPALRIGHSLGPPVPDYANVRWLSGETRCLRGGYYLARCRRLQVPVPESLITVKLTCHACVVSLFTLSAHV